MEEHRHAAHRRSRNHRARSVRRTNHRVHLLLSEDTLNRQGIRLIGVEPVGGGVENPENTLVQGLRRDRAGNTHVHEVRLTVGGHIEHGEAAAGQTRVNTHDAGCTRHTLHSGGSTVLTHAIACGRLSGGHHLPFRQTPSRISRF